MRKTSKFLFLFGLVFGFTTPVIAQIDDSCPQPDSLAVTLDGSTASESELLEVQAQVQAYANASLIYIECIEQYALTAPAAEHEGLIALYNEAIVERQNTVEAFNVQVRAFQESQPAPYADVQSADQCPRPDAYAVTLDGNTASQEEMVATQAEVQAFAGGSNAYMDCLREVMPRVSEQEQNRIVELYNAANAQLVSVADAFNAQVRVFRARAEASAQ